MEFADSMKNFLAKLVLFLLVAVPVLWFVWPKVQEDFARASVADASVSSTSDEKAADKAHRARTELLEVWLAAADEVANRAQTREAKAIAKFLRKHGVLGTPSPSGNKVMVAAGGRGAVLIVPLVAGDRSLSETWRQVYDDTPGGSYEWKGSGGRLFLTDKSLSETAMGIILLHEGDHAMRAVKGEGQAKARSAKPEDICDEEIEVYRHQFEATLGLWRNEPAIRDTYLRAIEREVERIGQVLDGKNRGPGSLEDVPVKRGSYDETLDRVFGEARTPFERDYRQTNIWLHAVFLVVHRFFEEREGDESPPGTFEAKSRAYCAIVNTLGHKSTSP